MAYIWHWYMSPELDARRTGMNGPEHITIGEICDWAQGYLGHDLTTFEIECLKVLNFVWRSEYGKAQKRDQEHQRRLSNGRTGRGGRAQVFYGG